MDFKITMIVMLKKAKEITHKTLGKVDHFNIELPPVTEMQYLVSIIPWRADTKTEDGRRQD